MGNKTRRRKRAKPGTQWCPHCGLLVPDSRHCLSCGGALIESKGKMAEDS